MVTPRWGRVGEMVVVFPLGKLVSWSLPAGREGGVARFLPAGGEGGLHDVFLGR